MKLNNNPVITGNHAMLRDGLLRDAARSIFGDIVIAAYFATEQINYTEHELRRTLNNIRGSIFTKSTLDRIEYDAETIVLEFSNGKKVAFTNSEWASISSATEDYYEIE